MGRGEEEGVGWEVMLLRDALLEPEAAIPAEGAHCVFFLCLLCPGVVPQPMTNGSAQTQVSPHLPLGIAQGSSLWACVGVTRRDQGLSLAPTCAR